MQQGAPAFPATGAARAAEYDRIAARASGFGLLVMGAFHPEAGAGAADSGGTLILLGAGAGFWPVFRASAEACDGACDPVDRWSRRVIGGMAIDLGARARFPFGGPPHEPFIDWALQTERAFQSPVGMLVHDGVGLMISFRGALHLSRTIPVPAPGAAHPCRACKDRPCLGSCPVGALGADRPYDLAACHDHLDRAAGQDCMTLGCAVRRACPLGAGAGRGPDQSALHMKAFHPT